MISVQKSKEQSRGHFMHQGHTVAMGSLRHIPGSLPPLTGLSSSYRLPGQIAAQDVSPPNNLHEFVIDPSCILEVGFLKFTEFNLPSFEYSVPAGYPSDGDDSKDNSFDLMHHLIRNFRTTYYPKNRSYD
jgi:hypothetical protein